MARRSTITLEGPTLRVCRKTAAEKLGASEDQLSYEIQQYGRKGWFSSTPFRVRFTRKDAAKERKGKGGLSERVDQYMDLVKRDLDRVEALDQSGLNLSFDELLESYEDLDEGSKKELVELAGLMSGTKSEDARRVVEAVSRSGEFTVTVSEDKQKAVLAITPPKASGKPVALKDVMSYLGQQNIVQGVDHVKIGRVLEECQKLGEPIRDVLIAEGTLPTRGRDGAAQVLFTPGAKEVLIDEAGRADYRGKAQIAQVEKDQPLVKILKATEGRAGTNVYGEPIPAPSGKSVQVKAGEGTYYDEEASEIRAAMDGVAEFDGTEVLVRPRVLVEDDVGMKTGNVEFDGEVEVRGSVLDNFAVRATGDVLIHGQVEGAEVVSTEGSVTVKKGVAGRGRCFISAAHTVTVRYVENATIYAGEEVVADRAILNSKVVAGKTVRVQVGKGMIAGGEVHAGELVDARDVGNVSEPHTRIVLGTSLEDCRRIEAIEHQIALLEQAVGKIEGLLKEIEGVARDPASLPLAKREEFILLKKQTVVMRVKRNRLEETRRSMEGSAARTGYGTLAVRRTLYGHVDVEMGGRTYHNEREQSGVRVQWDTEKGEIIVRGIV